jgi:hypothetical protein
MFSSVDRSLVRIIRQREPKLTPKDIVESLRRLDIRIESVTPLPEPPSLPRKSSSASRQPATGKGKRRRKTAGTKKHFGVPLKEVIEAGLLCPPLRLFRKYKGQIMEATLLADGSVEMRGERYPSCSTAAEIARSFVTGRVMHTNGWSFWQYLDGNGKAWTLFDAREKYLESRKES